MGNAAVAWLLARGTAKQRRPVYSFIVYHAAVPQGE